MWSTAASAGRSTTRLVLSDAMRRDMVAGLRTWRDEESRARRVVRPRRTTTVGRSNCRRAPLGVVGLRVRGAPERVRRCVRRAAQRQHGGVPHRLRRVRHRPGDRRARAAAGAASGRPSDGAVQLVESRERSAGHALFDDRRLALAVARGSGAAVSELGAVASQAGTPVSLHGTGGAWMIAGDARPIGDVRRGGRALARPQGVQHVERVRRSPASRAGELRPGVPRRAAAVGDAPRHERRSSTSTARFGGVPVGRRTSSLRPASTSLDEPLAVDALGTEWEWERVARGEPGDRRRRRRRRSSSPTGTARSSSCR